MGKTVAISDDVHLLITKKQISIFEKYRISVRISDIVNTAIKCGIDHAVEAFTPNGNTPKLDDIEEVNPQKLEVMDEEDTK